MTNEFRSGGGPLFSAMIGAGCGMTSVVFYTHGVFAVPIASATGWLRSEVQFAFTLLCLMAVITAPAVGWLIDRFSVRRVALWSVPAFFVGFASLSLTGGTLWGYYAAFLFMSVIGAGTLPVTWTTVVNQWFHDNRGIALGIALTGTGIAATLAPPYAGWLIAEEGWQSAYFWLALTVTAIALPIVFFLFRSPVEEPTSEEHGTTELIAARLNSGSSLSDALRSYRLWVLCFAIFLVSGSVAGLITSFVALLTDLGFSLTEAAGFASIIGFSVIAGRLGAGVLVDLLWAPAVAAVLLACPAVAAFTLDAVPVTPLLAGLCAVLIGLGAGAEVDLLAFLTSRYFGLRRYGSIYAVTFVFFSVSAGLAPAAFGLVHDWSDSYSLALRCTTIGCAVGAVAMLTLGAYPDFGTASEPEAVAR